MVLSASDYWRLIHAERARIADMIDGLTTHQWHSESLCTTWTIEDVVAHLTAAANTGTVGWIRSITFAGFNADRHNARRLAGCLGHTPQQTAERFRESVGLTRAPTKDHPAYLGEVIVHGQDIARPLGIQLTPDLLATREVAEFFARNDFAVKSRSLINGLALEANDADFATGRGKFVRGPLLSLVMTMAGRRVYCADLDGEGVVDLLRRMT